jgi:outer membrane biosynthesis protein TonB
LRRFLVLAAVVAAIIAFPLIGRAASGDIGYRDYDYNPGFAPTGSKPESKLWFNDGSWWAVMFAPGDNAFGIFRLDRSTQAWIDSGTRLDARDQSRSDALWDGSHLYVASHLYSGSGSSSGNPASLYRLSYAGGRYTIDAGFPVAINDVSSETLVIDRDSTGTLWATWTANSRVFVNHTLNGNDASWGSPYTPVLNGTAVSGDDISSLIAFGGNRIGLMWSNENDDAMYFATHVDGADPGQWTRETALGGPNLADDHINLKADSSGRIYAAVKTSESSGSSALIRLLVRDTGGTWSSHTFATVADGHTRPIVVLDEQHQMVHMFASGPANGNPTGEVGGIIFEKSAPMSDLTFPTGEGTPVMADPGTSRINNATSSKQNVSSSTGMLVLAGDDDSDLYWHTFDPLDGTVPTPTATPSATVTPVPTPTATPAPGNGIFLRSERSTATAETFSLQVNAAPDVAAGDVLLASLSLRGTPTITAPLGWQLVRMDPNGTSVRQAIYLHVATDNEPASYNFTFSRSAATTAIMMAFGGVDTSNPVDASSGQANDKSTLVTAPSLTTTAANDVLVGIFGIANQSTFTPPSGMSEVDDLSATTATYKVSSEAAQQTLGSAGATGTRTAVAQFATLNIGQLVALRAAPGGTPNPTPTPTPTATPTATPTVAPTPTPTPTDTPLPTPTVSPTATPTVAPTPTPTVAPTPTPTVAPTPTPTVAPTPTPTVAPTPTPTPSGTPATIALHAKKSTATAETLNMSVATPSPMTAGDVIVASISVRGQPIITQPAGWDMVEFDRNGNSLSSAVYTHVVGANEPTSYVWQFSKSSSATAILMAYSGVDATTPVDVAGGQVNSKSTTVAAPSVTTTSPGATLLGLFSIANGSTFTPPAGMTEIDDLTASSARYLVSSEAASQALTAVGPTGTRTARASGSNFSIGQLVALRPATVDGAAALSTVPQGGQTPLAGSLSVGLMLVGAGSAALSGRRRIGRLLNRSRA